MPELVFHAASSLSLQELTAALNQAFEGYLVPMRHTPETLGAMVRANDLRLDASVVARTAEGTLVGIGMLGARGARGWVGGMAVVPVFRGTRHGAALLDTLISRAHELDVRTLHLEVLEENERARKLYARRGFVDVRPLSVYTGPLAASAAPPRAEEGVVTSVDVEEALAHYATTHHTAAPWQREAASLHNIAATLEAHALEIAGRLRAYVLAMATGPGYSIMDFGSAAATAEGRARDGSLLVSHLATHAQSGPIRAINVPPGDALGPALDVCGCPVVVTQREMTLRIA